MNRQLAQWIYVKPRNSLTVFWWIIVLQFIFCQSSQIEMNASTWMKSSKAGEYKQELTWLYSLGFSHLLAFTLNSCHSYYFETFSGHPNFIFTKNVVNVNFSTIFINRRTDFTVNLDASILILVWPFLDFTGSLAALCVFCNYGEKHEENRKLFVCVMKHWPEIDCNDLLWIPEYRVSIVKYWTP